MESGKTAGHKVGLSIAQAPSCFVCRCEHTARLIAEQTVMRIDEIEPMAFRPSARPYTIDALARGRD